MKTYDQFRDKLASYEGNWKSVNSGGCVGRYQFCKGTYQDISKKLYGKIIPINTFLNSPEIQNNFLDRLVSDNANSVLKLLPIAQKNISPTITLSGLVGGAHLKGYGNDKCAGKISNCGIMNYVLYGIDSKDGNGTPISKYVFGLSGYEIPGYSESDPGEQIKKKLPLTKSQTTDNTLPIVLTVSIIGAIILIVATSK